MHVTRARLFKRLQANPAEMDFTSATLYVVAAIDFLHRSLAFWTILYVGPVLALVGLESLEGTVLVAALAVVIGMTRSADPLQALGAHVPQRGRRGVGQPIDVAAVGRRTVMELVRSARDVRVERGF